MVRASASAAAWAALAVGLQLWAAAHGVPAQVALKSNTSEPGSRCWQKEYFDKTAQRCCSMCPPGQHVKHFCTETTDTVCADCEDSTYTGLWNWVSRCLSCGARCSSGQIETQACTRERNRACTCRPGWYCMLGKPDNCRLCLPLRECGPGYGVARKGTWDSNILCAPCAPGTFSNTVSSTDTCRPHRACDILAVPGNASMDAICLPSTRDPGPEADHTTQPPTSGTQPVEPSTGPSPTAMDSTALPPFPRGTKPPAESSRASISLPIGLIVGVTALSLLLVGLVNCVILTQKKKNLFCLPGEAKVPHLPAEKEQQQHLLTTAPSSSSSSLESSASGPGQGTPARHQAQTPATDQAAGPGGAAWASSRGSEPPGGGHGTQVKVTCIVSVCGSSEHGSRCSSQDSAAAGDTDANAAGSPEAEDEQVPFSKEERPFYSQTETPETLLQSPEEKPLPLGVPDAGMKAS
ncbi:tumor necrosis factor receptor superfamily member 1B isoform X2 [Perognathus longimembris pacificus]|uniref:tumor necrosis factor receptor superfamily member 1B isoform X2 n=1 Tax=Perognathus longimembris pacificus TaxID=214514 RepID=UPI002018BC9F|nr:tumor necrosis factor receptor superfamily member 1B isoform X2 [Perognathus longimembris pacificus]